MHTTGAPISARIAICHSVVAASDAIGHDILGMYAILSDMGFPVTVLAEVFDGSLATMNTLYLSTATPADFDVIIYHHSIYWAKGERFLEHFSGHIIFRYHNVTPPEFFEPYSSIYAQGCAAGIRQTSRLITRFRDATWLADSGFNRQDLIASGAHPDQISVVPPFNLTADYLAPPRFHAQDRAEVLFIGRFVPQKAHADLVRIVHSYFTHIGRNIQLRIVGTIDDNLRGYCEEIQRLIDDLGARDHVEIVGPVPQLKLHQLLRESTVFLCCSRHEGFCVPVIEAQAAGLPVIAVKAGALQETLGPDQIVWDPPHAADDYLFYASLIHELAFNPRLRRTVITSGYRNVMTRFCLEAVQNSFVTSLIGPLQVVR
jgi:glycosyltransferase involved in cell wall biosynthesis